MFKYYCEQITIYIHTNTYIGSNRLFLNPWLSRQGQEWHYELKEDRVSEAMCIDIFLLLYQVLLSKASLYSHEVKDYGQLNL